MSKPGSIEIIEPSKSELWLWRLAWAIIATAFGNFVYWLWPISMLVIGVTVALAVLMWAILYVCAQ